MITAALVGVVVHELVVEMRVRGVGGVAMAASSDELTSLPSRAAWEERIPQELKRASARAGRSPWRCSCSTASRSRTRLFARRRSRGRHSSVAPI